MTIIDSLIDYFETCPIIQSLPSSIKVDFLTEKGRAISIEPTPTEPVVRNYIGGSCEKQFTFSLAVKFNYSDEARMNIENSAFFSELEEWLDDQVKNGNLPILDDGKEATLLEVTSNSYLFGVTQDMKYGRYQIQCRLVYDAD